MATNKTVSADNLAPHTKMQIRGRVTFSAVTKLIDGEALEADIKRARQQGRLPIEKPHTRIAITEATVPCADPQNPTPAERYVMEHCYMSNSQKNPGLSFQGVSKSPYLPWIAVRRGNDIVEIQPQGELASNQFVTLIMEQFPPKNAGMYAGVALIGVICEEEPKWRTPGGFTDLSALGMNFVPLSRDASGEGFAPAAAAPVAPAAPAVPQTAPMAYGAAQAAPAAAPGAVPAQTGPFSAGPQAPAAPVAPAEYNPFDAASAPVYAAPGVAAPQAPGQAGINYNPGVGGEF